MTTFLARLNWCQRLVGTAISFSVFGIGGLVIALGLSPALHLMVRDGQKRQKAARRFISASFCAFAGLMRLMGVMTYRFDGLDQLCADRGCLLVANHPTLIDYVLLASVLPDLDCIVKRALWRNPFLGGAVRVAGYIPNDDGDVLEVCRQRLEAGAVLLIFPEGTRTAKTQQPGQPLKLERGAANIAARSRVTLRLVHITCEPLTLSKFEKWYQIPARKPHFEIKAQQKLAVEPFLVSSPSEAIAARRITDFLSCALVPAIPSVGAITD